jgi:hypothetical protein
MEKQQKKLEKISKTNSIKEKLPKSLKIGPIRYRLKVVPEKEIEGDLGETFFKEKIIKINETLPEEVLQATLMHEILHGIDYLMDHEIVEMLSNSLCLLFKENKKLKDLFF